MLVLSVFRHYLLAILSIPQYKVFGKYFNSLNSSLGIYINTLLITTHSIKKVDANYIVIHKVLNRKPKPNKMIMIRHNCI